MLNGFHSPMKFVSLKDIHRYCEDLCSTEHIQGPRRALQTEIAGVKKNQNQQIHALKSCRNRFPVLETRHKNLEMVDNYTPVKESKLISCAHFSFLFLTACFPVLEMNPSSRKCEVKWLNSLLSHNSP